MAKRKIPTNMQPWKANINGEEYEYQSGITADVPEEVAALIDFIDASAPKRDPKAAQRAIEGEVTQIVKDNFAGGVGYEETTEAVIVPETSFECVGGVFQTKISDSSPSTFKVGQDYTVTLDGETNTYTADEYGQLINTSEDDWRAGDGWLITVFGKDCVIQTSDPSLVGAHTISISGPVTKRYVIDKKYLPAITRALFADNPSNITTDQYVPLTYDEAFSLWDSKSPVFIWQNDVRYTVIEIRAVNFDEVNETGYKYIYFDVMDNAKVKTFTIENPNWGGTS